MSWCRQRRGPASLARAAGRQNADRDAGWRPRPSGLRQLRVQRRDTRTPHSAAERLADRGDPGQAGAAGDRILLGRGRPDLLPRRSRRGTPHRSGGRSRRDRPAVLGGVCGVTVWPCLPSWPFSTRRWPPANGAGQAESPSVARRRHVEACRRVRRPPTAGSHREATDGHHARAPSRRNAPGSHERPSGPHTKPRTPPGSHGRPPCPPARTPERTRTPRTAIRPAHRATGTHPEATNGHPARPPAAGTRREVMNGHHARLNCRRIPPPSHWRRAGGPSADGAGLSRRRPMSDRRSHEGHEHLVDDGLGHRIGNRLERHQQLLPVEVEGN